MASPTRQKGEVSEGMVLAALLKLGKTVLLPFGGGAPYDLVVDLSGKLVRVQCKTARVISERSGVLSIPARHRTGNYRGLADVIAAYAPSTDKVYWLEVAAVGRAEVKLRISPARNNQVNKSRAAADFEIERVL